MRIPPNRSHRSTGRPTGGRPPPDDAGPTTARERFRELDDYRVGREWSRYEGTPQRDLLRTLRVRFLKRHSAARGTTLEIGPGPGRFSPSVGAPGCDRVALDLSEGMLRAAAARWPRHAPGEPVPELVRGDGVHPPFRERTFNEVVALGNPLGFSGERADEFLAQTARLVAPDGLLILESVAGSGERSTYLTRLPPGAVRRMVRSPLSVTVARVEREGFAPEPDRKRDRGEFRRWDEAALVGRLASEGFELVEAIAVAPALGVDAERVAAVEEDALSWRHLLELEEALGRAAERRRVAAALLVAARRSR